MTQLQELPEPLPSAPTTPPRSWGKLILDRLRTPVQTGIAWYRQTTHRLTDRWHIWQDNRQGRTEAQAWLSSLVWYRLRYGSAELAEQGLTVLTGATGCGRVALLYQPQPLPHLYLGLPPVVGAWGQQVAQDYQFSLNRLTTPQNMTAGRVELALSCDWQRPFLAYLISKQIYLGYQDEDDGKVAAGCFWPQPQASQSAGVWRLPTTPPFGLTTRPVLPTDPIPDTMKVTGKPPQQNWLLGYAPSGQMVQAPTPQVNLYGNRDAVTVWLEQATLTALAIQPAGLIIIDGQGDLTQRLKRHALVTGLLNRKQLILAQLTEGSNGRTGFNPLAGVPGEGEAQTVERWQTWFASMGCRGQAEMLLPQAYQEGVRDINKLRLWLAQPARLLAPGNGLISLQTTLNRLLAEAAIRDWLEWPTNLFATGAERALLCTCPGEAWGRKQMLKALLLGFQAVDQTRLILTGIDKFSINPAHFVLVGNGLRLPQATPIMTTMPDKLAHELLARFKPKQDAYRLSEQIQLLAPGEGVVLTQAGPVTVSFTRAAAQANGFET